MLRYDCDSLSTFGWAYTKIGTIQRRLAWPLRKDDTQNREAFHIFYVRRIKLWWENMKLWTEVTPLASIFQKSTIYLELTTFQMIIGSILLNHKNKKPYPSLAISFEVQIDLKEGSTIDSVRWRPLSSN